MNAFELQAERTKLARLLGVGKGEVTYLDELGPQRLRALREGLSDALFGRYRKSFQGMAKLANLAPLRMSAKLAETVFGPMLSARVAGELPVKRAVALAKRLPVEFLAEVTLELDPRRVRPVLAEIPPRLVAEVTELLADRGEYVTMGRFVDCLSEAALQAAIDAIASDEVLLRIGFFVEDKAQLAHVVRLLSEARRRGTIDAAAEQGLWIEALSLMQQLDADQQADFGKFIAELDDAALAEAVDAIKTHDQWALLTNIIARQEKPIQQRLGAFTQNRNGAEFEAVMRQAGELGLTQDLSEFAAAAKP